MHKYHMIYVGAETNILNGQLVTVSISLLIHVIKNLFYMYEYKLKLANDTRVKSLHAG